MKTRYRYYLSMSVGILVLIFLIYQITGAPLSIDNSAIFSLFVLLIVFTTAFGVPFGGGTVSFLPMSTIAALLIIGQIPAGWAAYLGAILHQVVRQGFGKRIGVPKIQSRIGAIAVALANAGIQGISLLVGGMVYLWAGGKIPFETISSQNLFAMIVLIFAYMGMNLMLAGAYMAARSAAALKMYLRSLPTLLLYEVAPLIFLPLFPLVHAQFGFGIFLMLTAGIVASSLIARNLALTSRGLERRIQELDSLQAVGQALSASLRLDEILPAVYDQVSKLMPVHNFYVALYFPEEDEVTFPLVIEDRQTIKWRSRKAGGGLTEFILRKKEPLLISANVDVKLAQLGIEHIGTAAASWLGVPLLSGNDPLGIIAVQSYTDTELYDEHHKDILETIATQAAIAIQNARLYERTDDALSRRVQELNSILRTSAEGMLMLNLEFRVLAANRALANFLMIPLTELSGGEWGSIQLTDTSPLLSQLGYTIAELRAEIESLSAGDQDEMKRGIQLSGPPELHLERTLTPVLDKKDQIVGWLLVYRDISEEVKLARLREDMVHMLVHDLRSPLTVLRGSFGVLRNDLAENSTSKESQALLGMAERSTDRMMSMVNGLLDIAKLEDGQMPLYTETVSIRELIDDVQYRVAKLADQAGINIEVEADGELPDLQVDPKHIRRVLENLIDNAIKFTPDEGCIKIMARLERESYPPVMQICVSDTGPGISEKAQINLFKKFQTDAGTKSRRRGTGLGLAYCKLVVEAHEGAIWIESKEGQGATFFMRLPVHR